MYDVDKLTEDVSQGKGVTLPEVGTFKSDDLPLVVQNEYLKRQVDADRFSCICLDPIPVGLIAPRVVKKYELHSGSITPFTRRPIV